MFRIIDHQNWCPIKMQPGHCMLACCGGVDIMTLKQHIRGCLLSVDGGWPENHDKRVGQAFMSTTRSSLTSRPTSPKTTPKSSKCQSFHILPKFFFLGGGIVILPNSPNQLLLPPALPALHHPISRLGPNHAGMAHQRSHPQ